MVFDRQISTKMQKFLIKTTLNSNVNIQFGVDILFIWPVARLTNNNNNQFYLYVNTAWAKIGIASILYIVVCADDLNFYRRRGKCNRVNRIGQCTTNNNTKSQQNNNNHNRWLINRYFAMLHGSCVQLAIEWGQIVYLERRSGDKYFALWHIQGSGAGGTAESKYLVSAFELNWESRLNWNIVSFEF